MVLLSAPYLASADVVYALPLKGAEHQIGNLLEWTTAFEHNSQVFVVEKSMDGVSYENAGIIEAAGESANETGYRFLDVGVNDKKIYYRLRQMDLDGTASFSQTIMVKKELSNQFMVVAMSRTVTNDLFELTVDLMDDAQMTYRVKNKKGELVQENTTDFEFGLNDIRLNLEDESEGTYLIELQIDQEVETLVIRKVDDEVKKKENVASKKRANGG